MPDVLLPCCLLGQFNKEVCSEHGSWPGRPATPELHVSIHSLGERITDFNGSRNHIF